MTFLAPLTGLIAGALAFPALLALYFLKLRRRVVRVSNSALWQQAVRDTEANIPFQWLRFNWLLILQLLALACLVLAAARPTIRGDGPGALRTALIIDCSASMNALDGDRAFAPPGSGDRGAPISRLDEALGRARELIAALPSGGGGQQVLIIRSAADPAALSPMTGDTAALIEALANARPSDQPGDLPAALRLARTLLSRGEDAGADAGGDDAPNAPTTEILIVSHGGAAFDAPSTSATLARSSAAPAAARLIRVGPPPTAAGFANLGIAALSARRDFEEPTTLRVFARLVNASTAPAASTLILTFNGLEKSRRIVDIPPTDPTAPAAGATAAASVPAAPENPAGITFTLDEPSGGILALRIEPTGPDLLAADNAAAVVVDALPAPRILVIAPGSQGRDADRFLLSSLEALRPAALEVIDAATLAERTNARTKPGAFSPTEYSPLPADLLIFDRAPALNPPAIPSLHFGAPLRLGDAAITITPSNSTSSEATTATASTTEQARILTWSRTHPLLRYASLESIVLTPPTALALPTSDSARSAGLTIDTLARTARGPALALITQRTPGLPAVPRIMVGFELAHSNWGPHFTFPIFLSNTLDLTTHRADARLGRASDTLTPIAIEPAPGATELTLTGPIPAPRTFAITPASAAEVSLGILDRTGLYAVAGATPRDRALAINLASESESLLRTSDTLEPSPTLPRANPGNPLLTPSVAQSSSTAAPASAAPLPLDPPRREIWPQLLLAALALLTAEWMLYAWLLKG
ncbi:BatA and WFA domain-containing protein [soil metagenome]